MLQQLKGLCVEDNYRIFQSLPAFLGFTAHTWNIVIESDSELDLKLTLFDLNLFPSFDKR